MIHPSTTQTTAKLTNPFFKSLFFSINDPNDRETHKSLFLNLFSFVCFYFCIVKIDLLEISNILNTGLDRETLSILVNLCEAGVHPEALAAVVKELRREAAAIELEEETSTSNTA